MSALVLRGAVVAAASVDGAEVKKDETKFLPAMGPQIEAARYSSPNADFSWVGWIGTRIDLVESGKWSGYFNPNVETILGHRVRSFEAVQANYSLELGVRRELGRGTIAPFFHHISRHVEDRDKFQAVDWNFLGLRYESAWPERWHRGGAFAISAAFTTLSSGVDYNWETRVSADIDVVRTGNRALFFLADFRHVDATASVAYPRNTVNDFRGETGFRRWQDHNQFDLFIAYEHRGDALITEPLVVSRALFGFRIRGQKHASPAIVPLP